MLANTLPYMPVGVHLAVVDPGVGSARRALALRDEEGRLFVGPDNGLLVPAAERAGIAAAHELANPDYALESISRTFHGRDLFAPAAAHLALGVAIEELGPPLDADALVRLDLPQPELGADRIAATILYVDPFGNIALNMTREHVAEVGIVPGTQVELELAGERFYAVAARTFADAGRATSCSTRTATGTCRSRSAAATPPRCCTRPPGQSLRINVGRLLLAALASVCNSPATRAFAERATVPDVLPSGLRSAAAGDRPTGAPLRAGRRRGAGAPRRAAAPTSWTPIGRPSSVQWSGTETAGWPVTLKAAVKGVNRAARSNCSHGSSGSSPSRPARAAARASASAAGRGRPRTPRSAAPAAAGARPRPRSRALDVSARRSRNAWLSGLSTDGSRDRVERRRRLPDRLEVLHQLGAAPVGSGLLDLVAELGEQLRRVAGRRDARRVDGASSGRLGRDAIRSRPGRRRPPRRTAARAARRGTDRPTRSRRRRRGTRPRRRSCARAARSCRARSRARTAPPRRGRARA